MFFRRFCITFKCYILLFKGTEKQVCKETLWSFPLWDSQRLCVKGGLTSTPQELILSRTWKQPSCSRRAPGKKKWNRQQTRNQIFARCLLLSSSPSVYETGSGTLAITLTLLHPESLRQTLATGSITLTWPTRQNWLHQLTLPNIGSVASAALLYSIHLHSVGFYFSFLFHSFLSSPICSILFQCIIIWSGIVWGFFSV